MFCLSVFGTYTYYSEYSTSLYKLIILEIINKFSSITDVMTSNLEKNKLYAKAFAHLAAKVEQSKTFPQSQCRHSKVLVYLKLTN